MLLFDGYFINHPFNLILIKNLLLNHSHEDEIFNIDLFRPYALTGRIKDGNDDTLYMFYELYYAYELFRGSSIMLRKASIRETETGKFKQF